MSESKSTTLRIVCMYCKKIMAAKRAMELVGTPIVSVNHAGKRSSLGSHILQKL